MTNRMFNMLLSIKMSKIEGSIIKSIDISDIKKTYSKYVNLDESVFNYFDRVLKYCIAGNKNRYEWFIESEDCKEYISLDKKTKEYKILFLEQILNHYDWDKKNILFFMNQCSDRERSFQYFINDINGNASKYNIELVKQITDYRYLKTDIDFSEKIVRNNREREIIELDKKILWIKKRLNQLKQNKK